MPRTMNDLRQSVEQDIRELVEINNGDLDAIEDDIHEVCDSAIPVYNSDLANMLAEDNSLAYPDDMGACDPDRGIWGIIQWSIYEQLSQHAYEVLEQIRGETQDRQDEWDDSNLSERVWICQQAGVSVFKARHDERPWNA